MLFGSDDRTKYQIDSRKPRREFHTSPLYANLGKFRGQMKLYARNPTLSLVYQQCYCAINTLTQPIKLVGLRICYCLQKITCDLYWQVGLFDSSTLFRRVGSSLILVRQISSLLLPSPFPHIFFSALIPPPIIPLVAPK